MSKKKKKSHKKNRSSGLHQTTSHESTAVAERRSQQKRDLSEVKMVTHLNTRFLVILASVFVLLGAATYFLHDYQVERNARVLYDSANQSRDEGDYEKAIRLLTQYVRLAPDDMAALNDLGRWLDESPPTSNSRYLAYKVFSELLRESPNHPDAIRTRYRLVQLMMSLGEFSQAEKQLERLLKLPPNTDANPADAVPLGIDRAELLFLLGQCEAAQTKTAEALASMLGAIVEMPARADLYTAAIYLAQTLGPQIPYREQMLVLSVEVPRGPLAREEIDKLKDHHERADYLAALEDVTSLPARMLALFPRKQPPPAEPANKFEERETPTAAKGPSTEASPSEPRQTQIADAQPLIGYLLQRINTDVKPEFKGHVARAEYFLARGDFGQVEDELDNIDDSQRNQAEVTLFESRYAFSKAGRLAQEGKPEKALEAILQAEQAARTGKQQNPLDPRYDLLLANAGLHRFDYEPETAAKKTALKESLTVLRTAIEGLPEMREAYEEMKDLAVRDERFFIANDLEVELRTQLIQTELSILESELFHGDELPADGAIDNQLKELEELTRDEDRLNFLKARRQFALLQRQILDGPEQPNRNARQVPGWAAVAEALRGARLQINNRQFYRRAVDLMLARCYQALNDGEARVALFRDAFERDTNWRRGRLEFARALRDTGRFEDANRQYAILWQQMKVPAALPEMLQIRIHYQQYLPRAEQQWRDVELMIEELRKSMPDNPELRLLHAELKARRDQFEEAEQLLDETLTLPELTRNQRTAVWQTRIELQLQRDDRPEDLKIAGAGDLLAQAREELGDCAGLELEALQLARAQSDDRLREEADRLWRTAGKFSDDDRAEILESLASAYHELASPENELKARRQLAALKPYTLDCQLGLSRLAVQQGDDELFDQTLQKIRAIEGEDGPEGTFQQASRHIRKLERTKDLRHYPAASELLARLSRQRPRWELVPLAQGHLEGLNGERDKQFAFYRQAIDLGTTNSQVLNQYLAYLIQEGREDDERELISKIKQEAPRAITPEMKAWERRLSIGDYRLDELESDLQASFDIDAKDKWEAAQKVEWALSQGTLSFLKYRKELMLRANPDAAVLNEFLADAEQHFLSAIRWGPNYNRAWTSAVIFYVATDNENAARQVTQQAVERFPADPPELKQLTLAQCYRILGDVARARQNYEQAAEAAPHDHKVIRAVAAFAGDVDDRPMARKYWNQFYELTKDDAPSLAAEAKTRLTHLRFLDSNTYAEALKSIRELEAALPEDETARLLNLSTQVQILQRYQVRNFQEKLVNVLDQVQERRRLPVPTQLLQINLYKTLGQDERAEQRLQELLKNHPPSFEPLVRAFAAEYFTNREMIGEATEQLDSLKLMLPEAYVVMALEAQLARSDDGGDTYPEELVRSYLEHLPETQSAETIVLDSVSRFQPRSAFNWLAGADHLQDAQSQARIGEAVRQLQIGNHENALTILTPLLERDEVQKLVYSTRIRECSALLDRLGCIEEAEGVFRRYLAVTGEEDASIDLIPLLGRQERPEKIEMALQIGEQAFNATNAVRVVGNMAALVRTKQLDEGQILRVKALLDRAAKMDPDNVALLRPLADFYDFQQQYEAAEATYAQILSQQSTDFFALNNLAWLYSMREISPARSRPARKLIDQAIALYGPLPVLLDTKATVEMSENRYSEAVRLIERAIEAEPTAGRFFQLSRAQVLAGRRQEARASYKRAEDEGLDFSQLHPLEQFQAKELLAKLVARN